MIDNRENIVYTDASAKNSNLGAVVVLLYHWMDYC
jgi:hypothetical protein